MRLTHKELIALHLLEFVKYAEALDVPPEMTQEGIARAIRIELPHFKQYVRPLVAEGLVRERTTHVQGGSRRRKVYDLTDAGKLFAVRLREKVKSEVIRIRDVGGVREGRVTDVLETPTGRVSLLDLVHQVMEMGIVDPTTLGSHTQASLVEMMGDAPKVASFVGRRDELSAITRDDGPRLTVVRGVAGIGKTSLAAKACELLRGERPLFWHRVRPWDTHESILAGIGDFLAALGKPGLRSILRQDEENRAPQVLREDLPNTRAFLVFDDAHEATRESLAVFRLLKDVVADVADSKVLILTRESLPFYDRRDVALRGLVQEMDLEGLGPQEISEFLGAHPETPSLAEVAHDLGGHPLFLELLRSSGQSISSQALGDIRRFVEEEVYSNISDAERKMMKLASLYRVPVPRDSLFPDSTMSHEILMKLVNRSLIRTVGEGRFEAHDAIREFFATVVTPSERRDLGGFAVAQLRRLAEAAQEMGDSVACIDSLSNALELSASKDALADLLEALGDAHERISALSSASAGYRDALQVTSDPETMARLHRKTAEQHHWLWDVRDIVEESFEQIEAGLAALGGLSCAERGWLYLLRAHLEGHQGRYGRLKEDAEFALDVFRSFGVVAGEVSALEELAEASAFEGDGSSAERYGMSALELIDSRWVPPPPTAPPWARSKPVQAAHAHVMMMQTLLRRGKVDEAGRHADAVARLVDEIDGHHERLEVLMRLSWFKSVYGPDLSAGERYCRDAVALAKQVHDESFLAVAENSLAFYPYFRGEIDEARRGFERAFGAFMAQGHGGSAIEPLYLLAECALLQGDLEAFRHAVVRFDDPKIQGEAGPWTSVIKACQGLDRLLAGDRAGFREAFALSLESADEAIVAEREAGGYMVSRRVRWGDSVPLLHMGGPLPYVAGSVPHLYYGAALAAIGEEQESKEHFDRTLQVLQAYSHKARLTVASDRQRRLAEVLRHAIGGS